MRTIKRKFVTIPSKCAVFLFHVHNVIYDQGSISCSWLKGSQVDYECLELLLMHNSTDTDWNKKCFYIKPNWKARQKLDLKRRMIGEMKFRQSIEPRRKLQKAFLVDLSIWFSRDADLVCEHSWAVVFAPICQSSSMLIFYFGKSRRSRI